MSATVNGSMTRQPFACRERTRGRGACCSLGLERRHAKAKWFPQPPCLLNGRAPPWRFDPCRRVVERSPKSLAASSSCAPVPKPGVAGSIPAEGTEEFSGSYRRGVRRLLDGSPDSCSVPSSEACRCIAQRSGRVSSCTSRLRCLYNDPVGGRAGLTRGRNRPVWDA